MNLFLLLQKSKHNLDEGSADFSDATDIVLGILRSCEVIPYKRSTINGGLHKIVAGAIVEAYELGTTIDVTSRRAGTYFHYGFSTKIIDYMDKAVEKKLLISPAKKAKGKLELGKIIQDYLDHYPLLAG